VLFFELYCGDKEIDFLSFFLLLIQKRNIKNSGKGIKKETEKSQTYKMFQYFDLAQRSHNEINVLIEKFHVLFFVPKE